MPANVVCESTIDPNQTTVTFTTISSPRPENEIIAAMISGNAIPNLRLLLHDVLTALDAAIPNKDQNRALKHLVRKQFDVAYGNILSRAYPDSAFGSAPGYALNPSANVIEAFADTLIQK